MCADDVVRCSAGKSMQASCSVVGRAIVSPSMGEVRYLGWLMSDQAFIRAAVARPEVTKRPIERATFEGTPTWWCWQGTVVEAMSRRVLIAGLVDVSEVLINSTAGV